MKLFYDSEKYKIYNGSMLDMLEVIEQNSIDSIVCDPPYELGFMGEKWDSSSIAFQPKTWEKCLKVLKPGGYLLAFGGSRTFHRIACAIEDAGFEIRDTIMWLYGSGFPKSYNIAKAISAYERTGGSSPKNLRKDRQGDDYKPTGQKDYRKGRAFSSEIKNDNKKTELTDNAKQWQGWGTTLKPAYEPIIVARKPFKTSIIENIMKYGVGGINIDECRIGETGGVKKINIEPNSGSKNSGFGCNGQLEELNDGRFPANVIHDGSEEVISGFPETKSTYEEPNNKHSFKGNKDAFQYGYKMRYGSGFNDSGSASRYFYTAKTSKKDREEGLEALPEGLLRRMRPDKDDNNPTGLNKEARFAPVVRKNFHPTVKPTELMQYLIRLVSPKGATILDPFMGSGSTGKAAMFENRERDANYKFIGIDLEKEYCEIAQARIDYALNKYEYDYQQELKKAEEQGQISFDLFGDVNAN